MLNIRSILPNVIYSVLWGNRKRWGLNADVNDSCWKTWQETYTDFYVENQRQGLGLKVNDAGYQVMLQVDLNNKVVLEIGPGDLRHLDYWNGTPSKYLLVDIHASMMEKAKEALATHQVQYDTYLIKRNEALPLPAGSVDTIILFYSLEHLYPLQDYLSEFSRLLKPGGEIVGAIPAEGGLAWGLGRYLTSRRWFKKNTKIDPDKIICWEHPNFADMITKSLNHTFQKKKLSYWPLSWLPTPDFNLVLKFIYRKKASA